MLDSVSVAVSIGAAILSPCVQVLLDQTIPRLLKKKWGSEEDVKRELRGLGRTLLRIQALLAEVETTEIKDRSLALWLMELKDAAYSMEDLLDEFATTLLTQVSPRSNPQACLEKIRKSRSKLDEIVLERRFLKLGKNGGAKEGFGSSGERITSSFVDTSSVLGRQNDLDDIVQKYLCVHGDESDLTVLPIVGMGGIGKTTLAQVVYNDSRVKNYFSLRMWVCVSENFDVKRLIREIFESALDGRPCALTNWDTIQCKLQRKLEKKRFLLVLDDMWCEDRNKWEMLCAPLLHGQKGSKVVITTRDRIVAKLTGAPTPYELHSLSDQDSWLLFEKCAFPSGSLEADPKLKAIGREIVNKLRGSPLAVKTIGRLLDSELKVSIWKNILESEIWELQQDENDVLPILRLSYQHLPAHLKLCFSSCSIFPRGYKFDKTKLVQIWMAQGLIHHQGKRPMEDIGSEYFDELCSRSFFHESKDSLEENKYAIHDLMHDMAKFVSQDEFCSIRDDLTQQVRGSVHHISLTCNNILASHLSSLYELMNLRTLLFMHRNKSNFVGIPQELFNNLRCIRVLDLSGSNIRELPPSICNLKHLRYIDLSNMASLSCLPISISPLYNLQTLNLIGSEGLSNLPADMNNLVNLRHLEANCELVAKVAKIGNLTSLQKLELFRVQKESGFEITQIKGLSQLHGCLCISNVEKVGEADVTDQSIISNKEHLDTLELIWDDNGGSAVSMDHHHVLQGLRPHANLKELIIKGYGGEESPTWMLKEDRHFLHNLETVNLCLCKNWKELPPLGHLQFLKSLKMEGLDGVEKVDHSYLGTFPSLRKLHLRSMATWSTWSGGEDQSLFPCLEELLIESCPVLMQLPPLSLTLSVLKINEVGLSILPMIGAFRQDGSSTPALSEVDISDCPNLTSLSQLQHLVALETLSLVGCEALTSIPDGWFGDLVSLKSLTMENCPQLKFLPQSDNALPSSLRTLDINACPGVVTQQLWRDLQGLPLKSSIKNMYQDLEYCIREALCSATALRVLEIFYYDDDHDEVSLTCCDVMTIQLVIQSGIHSQGDSLITCLQSLTSISHLRIEGCSTITALSSDILGHLIALREMTIVECEKLESLEFQALPSLQSLTIEYCPRLRTCVPRNNIQIPGHDSPSMLNSLRVSESSLFAASLCNLTSLKELILESCPPFTAEHEEWLTTLISLQKLKIIDCADMVSLPVKLKDLQCLDYLYLQDCRKVRDISVTCLPSSLKDVIIKGCMSLTNQCRSADWPAHIANISIDGEVIRGN